MKGSTNQTTNASQTLSCGQPCLQTACSWQRPSYAGLSPRFQVALKATSRWEIKQLGDSFISIFLLLSFESSWEPPLNDNPVMGSEVCMSLVWISKAAISHIEESEVMLLSVFYYCICDCLCHCHGFNPSPCCCNHFTVSMPCDVACQDFRVA